MKNGIIVLEPHIRMMGDDPWLFLSRLTSSRRAKGSFSGALFYFYTSLLLACLIDA
ncbi:hypothetical protein L873DRAFT_1797216 [Choiromyces venosus 120613-1]|uniref:Uncharacterized protein n=1 Tax=Choiromyces venosus 120613-1 TaxID=1336337 RepID=A0A3N4K9W1_9PEZI|nr:hypothetical protein L873DRAFT_1797216 [Choiromyces venosus 120613-1]